MSEINPVTNPLSVESTVRTDPGLGRSFAEWQAKEEARCSAASSRFYRYGSGAPEAKHFPRTTEHMDALKALAGKQPDGVANLVRGNLRMSPKDTMGTPLHDGKIDPDKVVRP
jgi:hypothetical protein